MNLSLDELQCIKREKGLYSLKLKGEIVYIGKSTNVYTRILEHLYENNKDFDDIMVIYHEDLTEIEIMEVFLIDAIKPKYNKLIVEKKLFYMTLPSCCKKGSFDTYKNGLLKCDLVSSTIHNNSTLKAK